ncbi:tyrosine-type recombinase/integrase [Sphingomonas sediminicola]|uniref:tyrosine-type recombinase/integrase n=1 Tax=Sphingomonas TaxID=13687 RepID=UPI0019622C24
MLLTGCRKSEALGATWDQFDLDAGTRPSSQTKQRREHRLPYSSDAAEILARRCAEAAGPHIYAGRLGAPLRDARRTWLSACTSVGLKRVRLHDLRHTFASMAASEGLTCWL